MTRPMPPLLPLSMTVFESDQKLGKEFSIGADGTIVKNPLGEFSTGRARLCTIEASDASEALAVFRDNILANLTSREAIGLGSARNGLALNTVSTLGKLKAGEAAKGAIARAKEFFQLGPGPAIVLLDCDGGGGLRDCLIHVAPQFSSSAMLIKPSASAGIRDPQTGAIFSGGGEHVYVVVSDVELYRDLLDALMRLFWLHGMGRLDVSSAGYRLVRGPVDVSTYGVERVIYEGAPIIVQPLIRDISKPVLFDGDLISAADIIGLANRYAPEKDHRKRILEAEGNPIFLKQCLTAAKNAELRRIETFRDQGDSERIAKAKAARIRRSLRGISTGTGTPTFWLGSDHRLELSDGKTCTVAEILGQPSAFDQSHCADPYEGSSYGRSTATILEGRDGGRPWIYSHAHGGCYFQLCTFEETRRHDEADAETAATADQEDLKPQGFCEDRSTSKGSRGGEASRMRNQRQNYQGRPVPEHRDALEMVPPLDCPADFPVQSLPSVIRGAVEALVHHVQAPAALCATSLLGACALATQAYVDVKVQSLAQRPISINLLVVAESGERKTTCDVAAMQAIRKIEQEDFDRHREASRKYELHSIAYEAEIIKIKRSDKTDISAKLQMLEDLPRPEKPHYPGRTVSEPTPEGLFRHLKEGNGTAGIFTSEGGQFLGGHGMNDEAKLRSYSMLCGLWDDGSAQRTRITGIDRVSGKRFSVGIAVQPGVADRLLADDLANQQGITGRFLICQPKSTIGTRIIQDNWIDEDKRMRAFHAVIREIMAHPFPLREGTDNELDPPPLSLSKPVWVLWRDTAQQIETECAEKGKWFTVRPAALKAAENMARLAAIFAVVNDPGIIERAGTGLETIPKAMMQAAIDVVLFYLEEARRLAGSKGVTGEIRDADALARWLTGTWTEARISPRIIQQLAPRQCRGPAESIQKKISALVDAGVLRLLPADSPPELFVIKGRSFREVYEISRPASEDDKKAVEPPRSHAA